MFSDTRNRRKTGVIEELEEIFSKIPGLGRRSARRAVYFLLQNKETSLTPLIRRLNDAAERVRVCDECANLAFGAYCDICTDPLRDKAFICVTEKAQDITAFERAGFFRGVYHVLGGSLNAFDDVFPENLTLELLKKRLQTGNVKEVMLALPPTREGRVTGFYLNDMIKEIAADCVVTTPACGLPLGGDFEFIDNGTLAASFADRKSVNLTD